MGPLFKYFLKAVNRSKMFFSCLEKNMATRSPWLAAPHWVGDEMLCGQSWSCEQMI
jgi:hypothetical protein